MASVVTKLISQYEESLPHADPRSRHMLLLSNSPVPVWIITIAYLIFVWLGPKFMRNRKPVHVPVWLMATYNLGLVVLSAYMFYEIVASVIELKYNFMCAVYNEKSRQNPAEQRMVNALWWYFFSKAIELLDTVLMIVRKKNSQVTFLHVFHHASMLNIWWWVMMFSPGGMAYFGSSLNCVIHVIMYSYYGLAAIPSLQHKLWWKKYITKSQLLQFVMTFCHTSYGLATGCDFPHWAQLLLFTYMLIMITLFTNFYIHAYKKQTSSRIPKSTENGFVEGKGQKMH